MVLKVLSATGHRPEKLYGYNINQESYYKLSLKMRSFILTHDYDHFISGMALGLDTIYALTVLRLKKDFPEKNYILECAIPCLNHSIKWNTGDQYRYKNILEDSDIVTYVSEEPYNNYCMQKRNEYMVDHSLAVIALWDGSRGGTKNCIDYANKKGVEVFNIW